MDTLKNGLSKLVVNGNANDFAKAILTTDTATKTIAVTETFGRDVVTMAGVAKGSGMIHPNMATMLGFITCDANISSDTLQLALSQNVEKTLIRLRLMGILRPMIWFLSCPMVARSMMRFCQIHQTFE